MTVQLLNKVGSVFESAIGSKKLSSARLMQRAELETGLEYWGQDRRFLEPLGVLIEDTNSLTDLSLTGKLLLTNDILNSLKNRLRLQKAWQQNPAILQRPIKQPLFIMSLPRTGSTFLLQLLCQDPAARSPLQWEMLHPTPIEGYQGLRENDPRIALAEGYSRRFYRFMPRVAKIHYMNPYAAGECRFLLQNSFVSKYYFTLLPLFRYNAWLDGCDPVFAYQEYFQQLQLLDFSYTNEHWVLKAPTHTPFIRRLLDVLPDARLIQIHRSPMEFVGSAISGVLSIRNCVLRNVDSHALGRELLSELGSRMQQYLAARKAVGWNRFCDVSYSQLVTHPEETVQKIYEFFGMERSAAARERMVAWLTANPQYKKGRHHYQLEQFGLDEKTVNSHFGEYLQRFQDYGV